VLGGLRWVKKRFFLAYNVLGIDVGTSEKKKSTSEGLQGVTSRAGNILMSKERTVRIGTVGAVR